MICNYNLTKARKPSLLVYKALEPIRRHPPACFTPSPTLTPTVTHRSEPVSISTSRYLWSLKQLPLRPPFIPALTPSQPSPQFSTSASSSPSVPMITCALPLTIIIASAAANLPSGSQTSLPQYFYMKHPPTLRSVLARSACLHSQTRIKPIKPITWSCAPAPLTPPLQTVLHPFTSQLLPPIPLPGTLQCFFCRIPSSIRLYALVDSTPKYTARRLGLNPAQLLPRGLRAGASTHIGATGGTQHDQKLSGCWRRNFRALTSVVLAAPWAKTLLLYLLTIIRS